MSLPVFRPVTLLLLLALPAYVFAQEESSREEERMEALARNADWYAPKTDVAISFQVLTSGANVHFGNLGTVPFAPQVAPASDGVVTRTYNNGTVTVDAPRANELDANGNQASPPGSRYRVTSTDASGVVTVSGDFVSYTPGLTRSWTYMTPDQALARPGYIAMNTYSTTSDGGSIEKKQGPSVGVQLQVTHVMHQLNKRISFGLTGGLAINTVHSKTSGDVLATLNTYTDYYSLHGQPAPTTSLTTPYSGPSYVDLTSNGQTFSNSLETTIPISAIPEDYSLNSVAGGTTVHGLWDIKGSYMMLRFGPSLRAQITEHLSLTTSLGLAGAYAGSTYSATESFQIPEVDTPISVTDSSVANKLLSGYYADVNLEWAANDHTGIYGGVSFQKLGAYDQTLDGRTAHIDIGSTSGVRGGVNIRF